MLTEEERIKRRREAKARWRAKNPDYYAKYAKANRASINANSARYIAKNPGYHAAYREENRDRLSASRAEAYKVNREKVLEACKRYRQENLERKRSTDKAYQQKNLYRFNERNAARRAARKEATPSWVDRNEIIKIYEKARELGMHVDHIVPLRSKIVCGLHCEANLQIIPAETNLKKSNLYWPDMP